MVYVFLTAVALGIIGGVALLAFSSDETDTFETPETDTRNAEVVATTATAVTNINQNQ